MKLSLACTFCFLVSIFCFSQEYKTRLLFEPISLAQVRSHEKGFDSKDSGFHKINVSSDYFKGAIEKKDYYPLIYRWPNDDFDPNCLVEYFHFGTDSIAKVVVYNWDVMNDIHNFKTGKNRIIAQTSRKEEYLKKYNSIYSIVVDKFGKPTSEEKIKKSKDGYWGYSAWKKEDKTIELFFSFTPQINEFGEFAFGTFRVRLKIDHG